MTALPVHEGRAHEGFFARQIRTNFRILVRMIGFERARAAVAEIVISEMERQAKHVTDRT